MENIKRGRGNKNAKIVVNVITRSKRKCLTKCAGKTCDHRTIVCIKTVTLITDRDKQNSPMARRQCGDCFFFMIIFCFYLFWTFCAHIKAFHLSSTNKRAGRVPNSRFDDDYLMWIFTRFPSFLEVFFCI